MLILRKIAIVRIAVSNSSPTSGRKQTAQDGSLVVSL
jgi:hypothetical protein